MGKPVLKAFRGANLYTPLGNRAVKGAGMNHLLHIPNAQIEVNNGIITYVGEERNVPKEAETLYLEGKVLLPGFIDPHTHLPFSGTRSDEFMWRLRGDSYMSIMERGGGIVNTMKQVREVPEKEMCEGLKAHMRDFIKMGFTTIEGKSGYGLDCESELKQLRTLKTVSENSNEAEFVSTFLGAHAVPPEYASRADDYVDFLITELLPKVKQEDLAKFCDVFCEKGVFSIEQSRRLLQAAKDLGFELKVHADEITCTGGAELAAELGATSADHLLYVSDSGIKALAASDTVAILLPLTAFTLNEPYAPARKLIDSGCAVALGTDFNPGSCYTFSVPLMLSLACIHMQMTLEEAITALTLNAAAALGIADRIGSIESGKQADFVLLDTNNVNDLIYCTGLNKCKKTFKKGCSVNI